MPPKKIKIIEEQIEYMNVPLKLNHRYATEEEALKNNKVLLWGKNKISKEKLEQYDKYLIPPKRITRAKEFRPEFLLAGEEIERREKNDDVKIPKSKLKDYEKHYISSHEYTHKDLPLLNKLYKEIGKLQDKAEEEDEDLYNKLLDDESELSDLIDKLEQEAPEEPIKIHPNKVRIEKLQDEINVINKMIKDIIPSPSSKATITSLSAKKNKLFDEIEKLEKSIGRGINHRKLSGRALFQKTHGKSQILQPYFYYGELPKHIAKTKWRLATAEEAINNDMVSLYGVHAIPKKLEQKASLVGHSGNFESLNDTQLELMKAKFGGKRSKIKKTVGDLILKLEHTYNAEEKDILLKKIDKLNEVDEELYNMLNDIIHKIANIRGKEVKEMKPREKFIIEQPPPKLEKKEPYIDIYQPKQKSIPKSETDIKVIETEFKPMKVQHIFKNDDTTIFLDSKYFKDGKLIDKYAKKLADRQYYFFEKYYSEKMCNKLLFHDTGEARMTGGKLNATKFFNQIGSSMKGVIHTIDSGIKSSIDTVKTGVQSGINYVDKVIHGSNEYLPPIKSIINKYGNNTITGVTIGRAPVPKAITGALNAVSGGTFKEGMNTQPYDKLFHLFLYLTLNDGTKILFEKNATINSAVNPPLPPNTETLLITIPNNTTTLSSFLQNGQNKMGGSYFVYDPHYNNCQDYIIGLLSGNGWGTPSDYKWIKQDVGALFSNNKYLNTAAKSVTNFGGVVDRVFKGVGFKKDNHIQSILFKRPKWTEDKAFKWLDKHDFKHDVDIKPNHLRYRQQEPDEDKYNYKTKKIGNDIEFILGYLH